MIVVYTNIINTFVVEIKFIKTKSFKMKPTITQALKGALISGVIALVLNQIWNFIALHFLGSVAPAGPWAFMVGFSSVFPLLIAGLVYFLLEKYTGNGDKIFVILSVVLTVLSTYSNFQPVLPDGTTTPQGFALLTVPMHFIAGFAAAFGIPRFSK